MGSLIRNPFSRLPYPRFTRPRNLRLFEWMNAQALGKVVLNLGSGSGTFDHYLSPEIKTIKLDIKPCPQVEVIADAHCLPIATGSIDIIYSIAVLEHVKKPWIVAEEIHRVLRPGGHVVVELPFLNVIHDEHDYFRFTDKGIRSLFDECRFEPILEQVGSGGGSFLSVFLWTYFQQFIPTRILRALWRDLARYIFMLLKYLDVLIDKSPELRLTANSFSFIGKKR
jgi:ubiquinone/menaquinone biosynthesis C-methylase UbiE